MELPDNQELHSTLSRLLLVGALVSVGLMLVATVLGAIGGQGLPHQAPAFDGVLIQMAQLEPASLIGLGLIVLFATPIASVVVTVLGFARQRDWFYVGAACLVLGVLALSALLAV